MNNPFALVPVDKSAHFLGGAAIALGVSLFFNPIAGVTAAVVLGGVKEIIIDGWFGWGNSDKYDWLATGLGGLAAGVAIYAAGLTGHIA